MKNLQQELDETKDELINWMEIRLNDLDSFEMYNQLTSKISTLKAQIESEKKVSNDENTAIEFLIENPYQDDFVNRNYHLTNQEGGDNSIELANYWNQQYDIVLRILIER